MIFAPLIRGPRAPAPATAAPQRASVRTQALFGIGGNSTKITVKKGDTLWGISNREGIPLNDLLKANNGRDLIRPGDVLNVTKSSPGQQSKTREDRKLERQAKRIRAKAEKEAKKNSNGRSVAAAPAPMTSSVQVDAILSRHPWLQSIGRNSGHDKFSTFLDKQVPKGETSPIEADHPFWRHVADHPLGPSTLVGIEATVGALTLYGSWRVFRRILSGMGVGVSNKYKGITGLGLSDVVKSLRAKPGKDSEVMSTARPDIEFTVDSSVDDVDTKP
jgi:hypothetical protein